MEDSLSGAPGIIAESIFYEHSPASNSISHRQPCADQHAADRPGSAALAGRWSPYARQHQSCIPVQYPGRVLRIQSPSWAPTNPIRSERRAAEDGPARDSGRATGRQIPESYSVVTILHSSAVSRESASNPTFPSPDDSHPDPARRRSRRAAWYRWADPATPPRWSGQFQNDVLKCSMRPLSIPR
jgi:hypothetical protein